jgi:hypothetical protein
METPTRTMHGNQRWSFPSTDGRNIDGATG